MLFADMDEEENEARLYKISIGEIFLQHFSIRKGKWSVLQQVNVYSNNNGPYACV